MGKSNQKGLERKQAFQRINYLYQAAHLCLRQTPDTPVLSKYYIKTMKSISTKNQLRLKCVQHECFRHPNIKRTICKKCSTLLIPGITSFCRLNRKGGQHMVITCTQCRTLKRFPLRKRHRLWIESPGAVV